jgi:hypothetical protein
MTDVTEVWGEHVFTGTAAAIREVFEDLPRVMREAVRLAAERPEMWLSYEVADARAGNTAGTFQRSFGGYRSRDPLRPRPFHLGQHAGGRFYLLVDDDQAAALTS